MVLFWIGALSTMTGIMAAQIDSIRMSSRKIYIHTP